MCFLRLHLHCTRFEWHLSNNNTKRAGSLKCLFWPKSTSLGSITWNYPIFHLSLWFDNCREQDTVHYLGSMHGEFLRLLAVLNPLLSWQILIPQASSISHPLAFTSAVLQFNTLLAFLFGSNFTSEWCPSKAHMLEYSTIAIVGSDDKKTLSNQVCFTFASQFSNSVEPLTLI